MKNVLETIKHNEVVDILISWEYDHWYDLTAEEPKIKKLVEKELAKGAVLRGLIVTVKANNVTLGEASIWGLCYYSPHDMFANIKHTYLSDLISEALLQAKQTLQALQAVTL